MRSSFSVSRRSWQLDRIDSLMKQQFPMSINRRNRKILHIVPLIEDQVAEMDVVAWPLEIKQFSIAYRMPRHAVNDDQNQMLRRRKIKSKKYIANGLFIRKLKIERSFGTIFEIRNFLRECINRVHIDLVHISRQGWWRHIASQGRLPERIFKWNFVQFSEKRIDNAKTNTKNGEDVEDDIEFIDDDDNTRKRCMTKKKTAVCSSGSTSSAPSIPHRIDRHVDRRLQRKAFWKFRINSMTIYVYHKRIALLC